MTHQNNNSNTKKEKKNKKINKLEVSSFLKCKQGK